MSADAVYREEALTIQRGEIEVLERLLADALDWMERRESAASDDGLTSERWYALRDSIRAALSPPAFLGDER